mgnify:FL=1
MQHVLPKLPYAKDALAPHISAETLEYHHDKHHRAYVDKLNELIKGTQHDNQPLTEIVMTSDGEIFNNAAQAYNHQFFWHCLSPAGGGGPTGKIGIRINERWGSFEKFKKHFSDEASGHFGSGWIWLVENAVNKLEVFTTPDAETPIAAGLRPLLTLDLWEHAYIDYGHERPRFIDAFWNIVNWDFVNKNL